MKTITATLLLIVQLLLLCNFVFSVATDAAVGQEVQENTSNGNINDNDQAPIHHRLLRLGDRGTMCIDNPVCAALGILDGYCCPNLAGEFHDCCHRECSVHVDCEQLVDHCCPTKDNVELDCCNHDPALLALMPSLSPTEMPSPYPTTLVLRRNSHNNFPDIVSFGGEPPSHVFPLQACQGDCDTSNDCAEGLACFHRGRGGTAVPGCRGGEYDMSQTDYCVVDTYIFHASTPPPTTETPTPDPTLPPTYHPTPYPTPYPTPHPTVPPTPYPTHYPTTPPTPHPTKTKKPTPSPTPEFESALCKDNSVCEILGLAGECCPTIDNVYLDCCYGKK